MNEAIDMSKQPDPTTAKTFGEFCRLIRQRQEMTLKEMAEWAGVTKATLSEIENDHVDRPIKYLKKIRVFCTKEEMHKLVMLNAEMFIKELSSKE